MLAKADDLLFKPFIYNTFIFLLRLLDDYNESIKGVMQKLVRKSVPNQITYIGELLQGSQYSPKMVRVGLLI